MPLNPELYKRLKDKFKHIVIFNEGEEMLYSVTKDLSGNSTLRVTRYGEQYRINCYACNDNRKRLYINYRWGDYDPDTNSKNLWLCHCFNENCLADTQRQHDLYRQVFDSTTTYFIEDVDLTITKSDEVMLKAFMPGTVVDIAQLPPGHPAAVYLTQRGFNIAQLSSFFRLAYCTEAEAIARMAQDRIVIPIFMDGEFVGWQARYVGTPPDKFIPKYYSMPGWRKSYCLYNFDMAKRFNHVVITEGPSDVWNYGPEAVCMFGKCAAPMQLKLLVDNWVNHIVLLDGDVKGTEIQGLADRLMQLGSKKAIVVTLPDAHDPGSMNTEYLRMLVNETAKSNGLILSERPQ